MAMNAGLLQNAAVGPLARLPGRRHAVYPPHCTKSACAFVTSIDMAATKKPAPKSRLRLLTNPTFFGVWGFVFYA
ncbi:hypothetical protein, partial [Ralstonia solanacearum]|uniref:hypothetical protein n=1 Tax=Ralstonia solanacearum TaxID=305 RepID=UPI001C7129D1